MERSRGGFELVLFNQSQSRRRRKELIVLFICFMDKGAL